MALKKIIIFNGKQFYNARHLHNHLQKHYKFIHDVTYLQVREATGKKLKSIDKFYKVNYELVYQTEKDSLKKWMQIDEGYERIIAFETRNTDDFIIKYLAMSNERYIMAYRNMRDEMTLAYKPNSLKRIIEIFDKELCEVRYQKILSESSQSDGWHLYQLQPTPIKQNIF